MNCTQALFCIYQIRTLPVNSHGLACKTNHPLVFHLHWIVQPGITPGEFSKYRVNSLYACHVNPSQNRKHGLLGQVASDSRQNQADFKSATAVTQQAQSQRDSVSAVSLDEEAVNLMTYQQAYQANMKVINTANQLFDDMLAAF